VTGHEMYEAKGHFCLHSEKRKPNISFRTLGASNFAQTEQIGLNSYLTRYIMCCLIEYRR